MRWQVKLHVGSNPTISAFALVAQLVERGPRKSEVMSSNLI